MSKPKEEAPSDKPFLGRPGNNVSIGIVGLPNIGKSTLFNLLSKLNVPAENFPFCTINPNVAKVPVPDARFDFLCKAHKPKSEVPAVLTVTDIAGLVKGANEGKGLGNNFLSHINAVDAIFHLVRIFPDTEIEHVEGEIDAVRDLEIISEELLLKDLQIVQGQIGILDKIVKKGQDKSKKAELELMQKVEQMLKDKKDVRVGDWTAKDVEILNSTPLLTAKPLVYLVNMSVDDFLKKKNKWLAKIHEWVQKRTPGAPIIPFSAPYEASIADMEEEKRKKYMEETKSQSMIPKIITTGYHALDLIHFFTAGEDEVRAWTIRRGTKAPQAAGVIHTDFEKGFICAEVMSFDDFKEHGTENAVKAAGKYKTQGKAYVCSDGDIMFFKFNASGGGAKKK